MIVTYDAVGNVLVENQVSITENGYPVALEMSPDGKVLMVSYLTSEGSELKSKVVCYNFEKDGESHINHQVGAEEYAGSIVPEMSPRRIVGESSDRDRSNLPHATVRPAPIERRSQILYDTVG